MPETFGCTSRSDKVVACYRFDMCLFLFVRHSLHQLKTNVSNESNWFEWQFSVCNHQFMAMDSFDFCCFCCCFCLFWLGGRAHANAFKPNRFNAFVLCVRGCGFDTYNLCFIGLFYRKIKVHVHQSRAIDRLHVVTHINICIVKFSHSMWWFCLRLQMK